MTFNRDFVCGLIVVALACGYFALTSDIQTSQLADDVGADGLPRLYAFARGGLGLALTRATAPRRATTLPAANDNAPSDGGEAKKLWRAAGVLAIGVVYVLLAPVLGYVIAIALVIVATAIYQGGAFGWRLVLIGAGGALFLWLVFVALLHIHQPTGLWPFPGT